ncbi:MAG: nucleotidyltransferase domain-containing protein [Saprospiraceae bacterium]
MKSFGETIRSLRQSKEIPLRILAAVLDIDQAILSKIERGQRSPTRAQVLRLAEYFKVKENDLLAAWLSDKLVYIVEDEEIALEALQLAEVKVSYYANAAANTISVIDTIKAILVKDGRVASAWLFGSVAKGTEKAKSDLDIMVEMNHEKKYSMFDLLDIAFIIENKINRKVDLVEKGYLRDFAMNTASSNLIKIYG